MRVVAIDTRGVTISVQQRTLVHRVRMNARWQRMTPLRQLLVDVGNGGGDRGSAIVAVQTVLSACIYIGQSLFCRRQKGSSRLGLVHDMAGLAAVFANRAVWAHIGRFRGLLTSPGVGAECPPRQPVIVFLNGAGLAKPTLCFTRSERGQAFFRHRGSATRRRYVAGQAKRRAAVIDHQKIVR